ncbi:MAG: carboxypeptidase regulatory-like domain-containing protein [Planctomycetota bacterium]
MNKSSGLLKWMIIVVALTLITIAVIITQRNKISKALDVKQGRDAITATAQSSIQVKNDVPEHKPIEPVQPVSKSEAHPIIFGIVIDANSNPVSLANIFVVVTSTTSSSSIQRMSDKKEKEPILTNINGEYRTPVLSHGKYTIYADYNGYQLAIENAEIIDSNKDVQLNIQLKKGGFISGKVTDEGNKPIKNVEISARDKDVGVLRSAKTDENGKYEVWGLSAPSCYVSAKATDYVSVEYRTAQLNSSNVDFVLKAGGRMEVRVIDKITKNPVKQDEIKIQAYWKKTSMSSESQNWDISTTENGSFLLKGLPAGNYWIQVYSINKGCYKKAERKEDVKVIAGETTKGITFELEKGGSIEGMVVDKVTKQPVKGCNLSYNKKQDESHSHGYFGGYTESFSQDDGSFVVGGLENGVYTVLINANGQNYAPKESNEITIKDANTVTGVVIELEKGGTVEGVVLDKSTRKPIVRSHVNFQPSGKDDFNYSIYSFGDYTDNDGKFFLVGLKDGAYVIKVDARDQDYIPAESAEVTIKDANSVTGIVIELELGGYISGKVTDEDNKPVERISISAYLNRTSMERGYGYTDENGQYRISGLKEASYTVEIQSGDYISQSKENININTKDVDFILSKGGKIEGKIIDKTTGMPVVEKDIYISCYEDKGDSDTKGRRFSSRSSYYANLDNDGTFTIENLKPGKYYIEVNPQKKKYEKATYRDIEVIASKTTSGIIIELMPGGPTYKITGLVLDSATRTPIDKANVYCYGNIGGDYCSSNATTDSAGAFTLDGLMANTDYHLSVRSGNYIVSSTMVSLKSIDVLGLEILLVKGGCIKGVVKNSAGQPLGKKNIMGLPAQIKSLADMASIREGWLTPLDARTGDSGQFEINGVAPGKYKLFVLDEATLSFGLPDFDNYQKEVEIKSDETVTCEIIFDKVKQSLCKVSGKFLKGGLPVAKEEIIFIEVNMASFTPAEAMTSEDGSYSVELKAGKYFILGDEVKYGEITVPNQPEFRFDIIVATLHIKGRVLDKQTQTPLDNASIIILKKTNEELSGFQALMNMVVGGTETDKDGNFTMENLVDGDFVIEVVADNYATHFQEVKIVQNSIENLIINLSGGGSIKGKVTNQTGAPVANVAFSIENLDINMPLLDFEGTGASNASNAEGLYQIKNINGGKYRITAVCKGFAYASNEVSVTDESETTLDFVLTQGGTLSLKVKDEASNPADKVNIVIKTNTGAILDSIFIRAAMFGSVAITDKSGAYERKNIAAGEYTGILKKEGYLDSQFSFTITENQDTVLELVIKK